MGIYCVGSKSRVARKLVVVGVLLVLGGAPVLALDINSSHDLRYFPGDDIRFMVDTAGTVTVFGDLDLQGTNDVTGLNKLSEFFDESCADDQVVIGVNDDGSYVCEDAPGNVSMTGDGTVDVVPKFIDGETIGDSQIYDDGVNVGIGTSTPGSALHVDGDIEFNGTVAAGDVPADRLSGEVAFSELPISDEDTKDWDDAYDASPTGLSWDGDTLTVNRQTDTDLTQDLSHDHTLADITDSGALAAEDEVDSGLLDETDVYDLDWDNLDIVESDVSASDVGLGNVRDVDIADADGAFLSYDTGTDELDVQAGNMGWDELDIDESDVDPGDVGLSSLSTDSSLSGNAYDGTSSETWGVTWSDAAALNGTGDIDDFSSATDLSMDGSIVSDAVDSTEIVAGAVGSGELDEADTYSLSWENLDGVDQSDVSATDVGLGSVRDVDLADTGGAYISYDTGTEDFDVDAGSIQSGTTASDVGLGNVENIAQSAMDGAGLSWDGTNNELDVNTGAGLTISSDNVVIASGGVDSDEIASDAVGTSELSSAVAGSGIDGGGGSALSVDWSDANDLDGSGGIDISDDLNMGGNNLEEVGWIEFSDATSWVDIPEGNNLHVYDPDQAEEIVTFASGADEPVTFERDIELEGSDITSDDGICIGSC